MPNDTWPEWEQVLAAAARLQRILPGAVLVGGSASALYAEHHLSTAADHVLTDLRQRFDQALAELESVASWKTARVKRPVQILGSLDGIETGVRQLIRDEPLETTRIEYLGEQLTVPTEAEILRIKGVLILKRNATRDYLDFVALAEHMGAEKMVEALRPSDRLYPQPNEDLDHSATRLTEFSIAPSRRFPAVLPVSSSSSTRSRAAACPFTSSSWMRSSRSPPTTSTPSFSTSSDPE